MQLHALVLLPPLLVLLTAMLTRRLQLSLFLGLTSGALIATQLNVIHAAKLLIERVLMQVTDIENLYVYTFLLCVGILITIINHTGAVYALADWVKTHITKAKQVEQTTFALSALLAIDDYLNSLTVGYILRPLADQFHIARCKLAYLVHTFAGPIVMLVPISTWGAFITSQLDQAGISLDSGPHVKIFADPFYVYLASIPFIYYALFTVITALIIVQFSLSFGPMYHYEQNASEHTAVLSEAEEQKQLKTAAYHLSDLLLPLGSLFLLSLGGMLYMGDYWLFGGSQSLIGAFKTNHDAFLVLCIASLISLALAYTLGLARKQLTTQDIIPLAWEGIALMGPAVMLVILASTLGSILRIDLQTGQYIASLLLHSMHITFLPFIFFAVSVATATMIGTAWGTIALLLPIGIPMAQSLIASSLGAEQVLPVLIPAIGAILAGATFGDHTSPISAAVIMSATSSGCKPADHLISQALYTLPPLVGACTAYLATGLLTGSTKSTILVVSLLIGILVTCLGIFCTAHLSRRKDA